MPLPSFTGTRPWSEVGARVGLSRLQAKRMGDAALAKLGRALQAACLDKDWLRHEFNVTGLNEERYLAIVLLSIADRKTNA